MSRKKNPFLEGAVQSQDMSLNITAMADIFTIILVFMLKSFGGGGVGSPPLSDLVLPKAKGGVLPSEMVKMEISKSSILIEGKPVMTLSNFKFPDADLEPNGTSRSLKSAFSLERSRAPASVGGAAADSEDVKMMVYIDRDTPYATIRKALASAAQTGYGRFRLVVQKDE